MTAKPSELSLWLDDFDDIYSDFDSRHFLKRRVSEDFLHELELALAGKEAPSANLVLLLPAEKRSTEVERNIVTSLHSFFEENLHRCETEYRITLQRGLLLLLTGLLTMAISFFLNYKQPLQPFFSLLHVLLEPCSWFLIWIGLEKLYYDLRKGRKEKVQFQILSQMRIHFQSSE